MSKYHKRILTYDDSTQNYKVEVPDLGLTVQGDTEMGALLDMRKEVADAAKVVKPRTHDANWGPINKYSAPENSHVGDAVAYAHAGAMRQVPIYPPSLGRGQDANQAPINSQSYGGRQAPTNPMAPTAEKRQLLTNGECVWACPPGNWKIGPGRWYRTPAGQYGFITSPDEPLWDGP